MSLSEELKKALYKQYFRRPSRLDTNLIGLMMDELICMEKDFYAPVQKIKHVLPNNRVPSRIIKIAPPKRNHFTVATLSAIAAIAISFMILALSHSSQADNHHGFFWWLDKNYFGSSMLTSPQQSSYDSNSIHFNSYELDYAYNGTSIVVGMEKQYNIPNDYHYCYMRIYNGINVSVYYHTNLLFLWGYNGYDYYIITATYDDAVQDIIQHYIDFIKDNE